MIGLIGSFTTRKKGHKIFLKAAKITLKSYPNAYFVLIGDGNYKKMYRYAKKLGIIKNVRFPGFYHEVEYAIAAMDIVVCASLRGEGLTGVLREALAMEKPVVSTDVAGNNEIVINRKTGLLVPVKDPEALGEAMNYILGNMEEAKIWAKKGRELVYELCTNEKRAEKIEKLYKSTLLELRGKKCSLQKDTE